MLIFCRVSFFLFCVACIFVFPLPEVPLSPRRKSDHFCLLCPAKLIYEQDIFSFRFFLQPASAILCLEDRLVGQTTFSSNKGKEDRRKLESVSSLLKFPRCSVAQRKGISSTPRDPKQRCVHALDSLRFSLPPQMIERLVCGNCFCLLWRKIWKDVLYCLNLFLLMKWIRHCCFLGTLSFHLCVLQHCICIIVTVLYLH